MRLFFASGIILFLHNFLHIKRSQRLVENNVTLKIMNEQFDNFSLLAEVFSRATGLEAKVIKGADDRLPDCYAGLNYFSLPLIYCDKLSGYIVCDHRNASDNNQRSAAIRLLHFIVNNISAAAEKNERESGKWRHEADFYYAKKPAHEKKLMAALRYIDDHLYDELSLESVAAHVCLSANYFSRFFKKRQGVNFKRWVMQRKMQRAGELLVDPDYSIDSVARKLQFAQTSYFCRVFRSAYRTTPQSFREHRLSTRSAQVN